MDKFAVFWNLLYLNYVVYETKIKTNDYVKKYALLIFIPCFKAMK